MSPLVADTSSGKSSSVSVELSLELHSGVDVLKLCGIDPLNFLTFVSSTERARRTCLCGDSALGDGSEDGTVIRFRSPSTLRE